MGPGTAKNDHLCVLLIIASFSYSQFPPSLSSCFCFFPVSLSLVQFIALQTLSGMSRGELFVSFSLDQVSLQLPLRSLRIFWFACVRVCVRVLGLCTLLWCSVFHDYTQIMSPSLLCQFTSVTSTISHTPVEAETHMQVHTRKKQELPLYLSLKGIVHTNNFTIHFSLSCP